MTTQEILNRIRKIYRFNEWVKQQRIKSLSARRTVKNLVMDRDLSVMPNVYYFDNKFNLKYGKLVWKEMFLHIDILYDYYGERIAEIFSPFKTVLEDLFEIKYNIRIIHKYYSHLNEINPLSSKRYKFLCNIVSRQSRRSATLISDKFAIRQLIDNVHFPTIPHISTKLNITKEYSGFIKSDDFIYVAPLVTNGVIEDIRLVRTPIIDNQIFFLKQMGYKVKIIGNPYEEYIG